MADVNFNPNVKLSGNVTTSAVNSTNAGSQSGANKSNKIELPDVFHSQRVLSEFLLGQVFNNVPKNVNVFAAATQMQEAGCRIFTPDLYSYAVNSPNPNQAFIDASSLSQGEEITTFNGKVYRLSNNPEKAGYVDQQITSKSNLYSAQQTPVVSVVSNNPANSKKVDIALIILGKDTPFYYSKNFDDSLKEDAEMMKKIAKDFGFKPDTKIILLETPSKEELTNAFTEIAEYQKANSSSKALVYFTGHGGTEEDKSLLSNLTKGAEGSKKGKLILGYEYTDKNTGIKVKIDDKQIKKESYVYKLFQNEAVSVDSVPQRNAVDLDFDDIDLILQQQKSKLRTPESDKISPPELSHPGPPSIEEKYNSDAVEWKEDEIYSNLSMLENFESVDFVIDACHSGSLSRPDFSKTSWADNAFTVVKDFFGK